MKLPACLLACLCALAPSALAQEAPRHGEHEPDLPHVALSNPAQEAPKNITLKFPNAPVADLLHYYAQLTGQQVVFDSTVQGQVNLESNGNVSREQAARLIEDALFANGFALVDADDGGTLRVLGLSRQPRSEGVPIYSSVDDLPTHERVVSYIVTLKDANPLEVAGFLQQYVPPTVIVAFTPSPRTNVLVITARTSQIRPLLKLVAAVDVPAKEGAAKDPLPPPTAAPLPPPRPPILRPTPPGEQPPPPAIRRPPPAKPAGDDN